jgi:hypothetical protein
MSSCLFPSCCLCSNQGHEEDGDNILVQASAVSGTFHEHRAGSASRSTSHNTWQSSEKGYRHSQTAIATNPHPIHPLILLPSDDIKRERHGKTLGTAGSRWKPACAAIVQTQTTSSQKENKKQGYYNPDTYICAVSGVGLWLSTWRPRNRASLIMRQKNPSGRLDIRDRVKQLQVAISHLPVEGIDLPRRDASLT